jgi:hypothetical protein
MRSDLLSEHMHVSECTDRPTGFAFAFETPHRVEIRISSLRAAVECGRALVRLPKYVYDFSVFTNSDLVTGLVYYDIQLECLVGVT